MKRMKFSGRVGGHAWMMGAALLAAVGVPDAAAQTLRTLFEIDPGTVGTQPRAGLIAGPDGDLFGTTSGGGAIGCGTVFKIARTAGGYASTPTILATFDGNGGCPWGGLIADANGNLFGTTPHFGPNGDGAVYKIAKTAGGYASTPTYLATFDGTFNGVQPRASLVADANGNLLGTSFRGGTFGEGIVFEIVKTAGGYASTPTVLVTFGDDNVGYGPHGGLIADANGNLFGTNAYGGLGGNSGPGTVFKIAKTAEGYASTATVVANFDGNNGANPNAGLIADAEGNLFGTTTMGGPLGGGTVFKIARTAGGYASTLTVLASFDWGAMPVGDLIVDANGNLFGTTREGGAYGLGTVFKIARTAAGYANTPTVLATFDGNNGARPAAGLVAGANGNLFGTTGEGGANGNGVVFEITGSGFAPPVAPYKFSGFLAPVKNPPTVNTGKAGWPYLIRWRLANANGAPVGALSAVRSITYNSTPCNSGPSSTDPLEAAGFAGSGLFYEKWTNQYIYVWQTPRQPGCYALVLTLDSGQTFRADFRLN